MARFIAEIQGHRGKASRLGTAASGISGHVRGWNIGGAVTCEAIDDPQSKQSRDRVTLRLTCGSSGLTSGNREGYTDVAIVAELVDGCIQFTVLLPNGQEVRGRVNNEKLVFVHNKSPHRNVLEIVNLCDHGVDINLPCSACCKPLPGQW